MVGCNFNMKWSENLLLRTQKTQLSECIYIFFIEHFSNRTLRKNMVSGSTQLVGIFLPVCSVFIAFISPFMSCSKFYAEKPRAEGPLEGPPN